MERANVLESAYDYKHPMANAFARALSLTAFEQAERPLLPVRELTPEESQTAGC